MTIVPDISQTHTYAKAADDGELSALMDIQARVFNFAREHGDRYLNIAGKENLRVVRVNQTLAGGLALIPMGQHFGGKAVPMMGVALVGVAPEFRASGAATFVMQSMLKELHAAGWAISTLYPATLPLYRRVGYEHAGGRYEIRVPTAGIGLEERDMEVRRVTPDDEPAIERLYARRTPNATGSLQRGGFIWSRIRQPRGDRAQGYVAVNERGEPEGYLYHTQKEGPEFRYHIHLTDFVALTPRAGRRLLTLLAHHRSIAEQVIWYGGANDPILELLPERTYSVKLFEHWMVRIVDVGAALTARGYGPGVSAELHLDVQDDLLLANNGRYVLEVKDGKPSVHTGGDGTIQIDIRGLAALYTGHRSPHDLRITGQLALAPRAALKVDPLTLAGAVFAGDAPAMSDAF